MNDILHSVNPIIWQITGAALFLIGAVSLLWQIALARKEARRRAARRPRQVKSGVHAYCSSIIGNRANQQDFYMIPDSSISSSVLKSKGCLAIVCDGMGGMQGGEKASRCCAELLFSRYYSGQYSSAQGFYSKEIPQADSAVASLKNDSGSVLAGGTTLVSVLVLNSRIYFASVGDSRIYLYRSGRLTRLTRDHNYFLVLSQMVKEGEITIEEAMADRQKDALISYVGMGTGPDIIDIEAEGIPVQTDDILLLCSDGLTKAMSEDEIAQLITANADIPAAIPQALTSTAFSKHWIKHDNITAAIVSCS